MAVEIGCEFTITAQERETFRTDLTQVAQKEWGITRPLLDDEVDLFFEKFHFNQARFGDSPEKAREWALRTARIVIKNNALE